MTGSSKTLLLASGNQKKLKELAALLAPLGIELARPEDFGGLPEVEEDQPDFAGNAVLKAVSAARATGQWSLADDSGLEVAHLDGAPGVHSARFAGTHGDDAANNAKLLRDMHGVPRAQRGARFVCALALAKPDGTIAAQFMGTCPGTILESPRGSNDFGYDPVFEFTEEGHAASGKSFAELDSAIKSQVSHRGRALRDLASQLQGLLAQDA